MMAALRAGGRRAVDGTTDTRRRALVLLLYTLLSYSLYNSITRSAPRKRFLFALAGSTRDVAPRTEPYSLEVTRDIQLGILGRLAEPAEDQLAFVYPLYDAVLILRSSNWSTLRHRLCGWLY